MLDNFSEPSIAGAPQDTLNLRPLPNALGSNGPYFGAASPIERDCDRIADHSDLFRDLERFEPDLREAIARTWESMMRVGVAERSGREPADILAASSAGLSLAFRFMQEAYLIAEVLNDREKKRIRTQSCMDFLALVPTTPPQHMTAIERLAEEGRITWQISALRDRLAEQGIKRAWPADDAARLRELNRRMEAALKPACPDRLNAMNDNELADELRKLETNAGHTKKAISVIHAIRTLRHAQND